MFLPVSPRRWPNLFLTLLAVLGLTARGHGGLAIEGPLAFAAFPVAVCHSGAGDRRPADPPMADCDACAMCAGVHGQQLVPLVPVGFVLRWDLRGSPVQITAAAAADARVFQPRLYGARAPPGTA